MRAFSSSNSIALINRLGRLYAATIFIVATLSITGQVITQRALNTQSQDAHTINIAGRQRMLSQKITKLAYAIPYVPANQQKVLRQELDELIVLFQKSHEGLQSGDPQLSLYHQNTQQVREMFAALTPAYSSILSAGREIVASNAIDRAAIAQLASREGDFLQKMNAIVEQYEREATASVAQLKITQGILLALTLLTLLPMLLPIRQVMQRVNNLLAATQRSSTQVSESSFQIAASGEQIESMASEQAATSAQITASSKEIATIATQLKQEISQVVSEAGQAQEKAIVGEQEIAAMSKAMTQLDVATQQVYQQLETIHERANDIDQVVVAMTKVSDQISLLSLNAAIEAEKAGKSGAGFSVVAREIRRLADKSAIATLEIETLVKEMQATVSAGVSQMDRFTQQVEKGTGSTAVVAQQLSEVIDSVKALLAPLHQVKQGMVAQSEGAEQIRDAMTQLSAGTEQTVQSLQDNNSALVQLQMAAAGLQEAA